jgi:hypothetical protein
VVTLGSFGFRVGGGNASGNWATPAAGLASGAKIFDRLWEIVPIVVESLIRGGGAMISERVERVEPPRGRGPNLEDAGERSWTCSISRTAVMERSTGSGGRFCDRFASR